LTPAAIAQFCEKWQIVELSLFGSILRDDFRPTGDNPSDVDFLYVRFTQDPKGVEISGDR
jgi:predicted nucleotidyltransferase